MTAAAMCAHRITIITGHYGTGKTEFAVNLALALARNGPGSCWRIWILSIPTSAPGNGGTCWKVPESRLISSSQACSDADVPALPAELLAILEDRSITGILDIGGDPVGARVLARFLPKIQAEDYQLLYVLNANRPEVRTPEAAVRYLRGIEQTTGLTCTGLVNNTHLCGETTLGRSARVQPCRRRPGRHRHPGDLPHGRAALHRSLSDLPETVFPITIQMKKPWE